MIGLTADQIVAVCFAIVVVALVVRMFTNDGNV